MVKNSPRYLSLSNQELNVVLFVGRRRHLKWDHMLSRSKLVPELSFWTPLHVSTSSARCLSRTVIQVAKDNLESILALYQRMSGFLGLRYRFTYSSINTCFCKAYSQILINDAHKGCISTGNVCPPYFTDHHSGQNLVPWDHTGVMRKYCSCGFCPSYNLNSWWLSRMYAVYSLKG